MTDVRRHPSEWLGHVPWNGTYLVPKERFVRRPGVGSTERIKDGRGGDLRPETSLGVQLALRAHHEVHARDSRDLVQKEGEEDLAQEACPTEHKDLGIIQATQKVE